MEFEESNPNRDKKSTSTTLNQFYVELMSFGYKYGPPDNAIPVFNMRQFPNPNHQQKRGGKTGVHKELRDAVFATPKAEEWYQRIKQEVWEIVQNYTQNRKQNPTKEDGTAVQEELDQSSASISADASQTKFQDDPIAAGIRIAIGCHSGKHRSVSIVERLVEEFAQEAAQNQWEVQLTALHRDIQKGKVKDEKAKRRQQHKKKMKMRYGDEEEGDT